MPGDCAVAREGLRDTPMYHAVGTSYEHGLRLGSACLRLRACEMSIRLIAMSPLDVDNTMTVYDAYCFIRLAIANFSRSHQ